MRNFLGVDTGAQDSRGSIDILEATRTVNVPTSQDYMHDQVIMLRAIARESAKAI